MSAARGHSNRAGSFGYQNKSSRRCELVTSQHSDSHPRCVAVGSCQCLPRLGIRVQHGWMLPSTCSVCALVPQVRHTQAWVSEWNVMYMRGILHLCSQSSGTTCTLTMCEENRPQFRAHAGLCHEQDQCAHALPCTHRHTTTPGRSAVNAAHLHAHIKYTLGRTLQQACFFTKQDKPCKDG